MTELKTQAEKRRAKIEASQQWLFETFHHYELEYIAEQLNVVGQWFATGCYLLASGDKKMGRHVCVRAMNQVIALVPRCQTKAQQVMRFVDTNCERFARAAGSRLEMNKAFDQLTYQDEEL